MTSKDILARYLGFWARLVLAERRPRIIGITGSVGKTTTKEAIAAVLMQPQTRALIGYVEKSRGNLNTEVGLPLAVLGYDAAPASPLGWLGLIIAVPFRSVALQTIRTYPDVLILEYGADRPGDITRLTQLAPPEVAAVTAVGPAHLEKFKTVQAIAHEKGALIRAVWPGGLAILARDNSFVAAMENSTHAKTVKVPGRGQELSMGIARVVGNYFGLSSAMITEGLKGFQSLEGRLRSEKLTHLMLIDDTYNANPLSMQLALDTLDEQAKKGQRRVAFLGEMKELGAKSPQYHEEVGRYARAHADVIIGVGPLTKHYQPEYWFATSADAAVRAHRYLKPGDIVLVKGSRSVAMEKVVAAIKKYQPKERRANHKSRTR